VHQSNKATLQRVRPSDSRSESTIANLAASLDPIKSPLRGDPGYPQYSPSYDQSFSRGADYSQPAYDQPPYNEPVYDQPSFPRNSFNQPAYAEPASHVYNEGYAHREGLVPSAGASSTHHDRFGFLKSKWPAAFMATTAIQAVICLVCESYVALLRVMPLVGIGLYAYMMIDISSLGYSRALRATSPATGCDPNT
jgi:hypothetical protein